MSQKVALVTGATQGIGLSIARRLAQDGYDLIINGLGKEESIKKATESIQNYGVKCLYHSADLRFPNQIKDMVDSSINSFGGVDVLVNNAGIQYVSPVEDFPEEKWQDVIQVNLSSAFYAIKYVAHSMKQRKWGRIINVASAHGLVASPFKSAYVAAKHGLLGLTKTVALELAEFGITANAVCPGYVQTDLLLGQIASTAKARNITEDQVLSEVFLKPHATKKLIMPDEVSELVAFLCRDETKSITGSALSIDAGWVAN